MTVDRRSGRGSTVDSRWATLRHGADPRHLNSSPFHAIHTPASSASTMSSKSPHKKPEAWVSNELRNTNWPKFTEWIKGDATAQNDKEIRGVFDAGRSLFEELRDRKGLEGEAAFRSWIERVKAHEVSLFVRLPLLRTLKIALDCARSCGRKRQHQSGNVVLHRCHRHSVRVRHVYTGGGLIAMHHEGVDDVFTDRWSVRSACPTAFNVRPAFLVSLAARPTRCLSAHSAEAGASRAAGERSPSTCTPLRSLFMRNRSKQTHRNTLAWGAP